MVRPPPAGVPTIADARGREATREDRAIGGDGVVDAAREQVLRREPVVGDPGGGAGRAGDAGDEIAVGGGRAHDEATAVEVEDGARGIGVGGA